MLVDIGKVVYAHNCLDQSANSKPWHWTSGALAHVAMVRPRRLYNVPYRLQSFQGLWWYKIPKPACFLYAYSCLLLIASDDNAGKGLVATSHA